MNLREILFSQHWFLSAVFIFLITLSLLSWYVIFKKIFLFKHEVKSIQKFDSRSLSREILDKSYQIVVNNTPELRKRKIGMLFERFKERLDFGQNFLASIANLTPFIGLFGTVLGIIRALAYLGNQAGSSSVMSGVSQALYATYLSSEFQSFLLLVQIVLPYFMLVFVASANHLRYDRP